MKTYYFSSAKSISIFSIMGLLSVVMASCGSYKNSSYYDGDGIYGGSEVKKAETQTQTATNESSQYKDYFSSLQKDGEVEVFTDVESYNSAENNNTATEGGYAGWGNNPENITVNVYDNNWAWNGWNNYFYGPSYGWGWNIGWNSWYGPSFGWGWNNYWYGQSYYPYYGWGWNNYYNGYYYPYYYGYGHHHYYPRNQGIRGSSYRGDRYESGRRSATGTRNSNYTPGRTRTTIGGTRTSNYNNPPRRSETPRNYSPNPRTNNPTPRTYTPTRNETSTPRSSTPRSESPNPRNYSSGSGSNSSSGGSYGGGRSGGGGRR